MKNHTYLGTERVIASGRKKKITSGNPIWVGLWTCGCARTASDGVYSDEHHHHHYIQHRQLVPVPPHVLQHPRPARLALVAQHPRRVAPPVAVRLLRRRLRRRRIVAGRRRLAAPRLHRRHLRRQVIERRPQNNLRASLRPQYAALDIHPVPRVLDPLPQPRRVVFQVILPVRAARHGGAAAGAGDDEPENGKAHQCSDEEEHDDKVHPQCPRHVEARADETGE
ncbi:hypothetical protein MIMGU_mgv1a013325mg [Erythranthe guttata]|uniref:Uncharacterized protein n=1 Tax=Erythranthe guttata TaxID=4155 RepID=A0A022RGR6_ERYGU|nr:hypothetical protein MIMGU_mgv1a013325mg [Erythranthe guttata]